MDRWIDGWMDRQMDRWMDGSTLRSVYNIYLQEFNKRSEILDVGFIL